MNPQVSGSLAVRHNTTDPLVLAIDSISNGSWMIVSVMVSTATTEVAPPAGWTVLFDKAVSGSRSNFLFAKVKEATDGASVSFTQSVNLTAAYSLTWGTGGVNVADWTIGPVWTRSMSAEPTGARYKTVVPSIITPTENSLVLAIAHEATLAMVQAAEISSISPSGWTQELWCGQVAVNDRIETIWVGSKTFPVVATTGDIELTYTSPQDLNAWALQVSIPSVVPDILTTPTIVGTPTTANFTLVNSNFTIARPSGVINGDYIIVAVRGQHTLATEEPSCDGFIRLGPAFVGSSSSYRLVGFYGHAVEDANTEPSSYAFTFAANNARLLATAFIVRGVDTANPIAGYFNHYGGTVRDGGRWVAPYTLASVPALGLFLGGAEFVALENHTPTTLPAGYNEVVQSVSSTDLAASRTYLWVGQQEFAGSSTAEAGILWGNPSGSAAESIALKGLAGEPPSQAGLGIAAHNGSGNDIRVFYVDESGARTPNALRPMRRGFSSVSEMLAKPGFTWAHRGGSASWPEMSLYAYTQAVARGYGVLEVSLGRTSDGVWFGLHDQSTDRTSGGTYGNASSQTWAQIQAQQIVVGANGAPRPYMRWEEIVVAYGSTHVLVVDPKYALGSHRTEFLNMVYNDIGTSRAIIKYSGVGSGAAALSMAAQALGFETWGFYYAGDASAAQGGDGALQTWGGNWTLLGMEHGASQAIWDEVLAFGRPVIGHIAATQTGYNNAMAKGASGVQVSGVAAVAPVSWWTP